MCRHGYTQSEINLVQLAFSVEDLFLASLPESRRCPVKAATGWIGSQPTPLDGGEVDNCRLRLLR